MTALFDLKGQDIAVAKIHRICDRIYGFDGGVSPKSKPPGRLHSLKFQRKH